MEYFSQELHLHGILLGRGKPRSSLGHNAEIGLLVDLSGQLFLTHCETERQCSLLAPMTVAAYVRIGLKTQLVAVPLVVILQLFGPRIVFSCYRFHPVQGSVLTIQV